VKRRTSRNSGPTGRVVKLKGGVASVPGYGALDSDCPWDLNGAILARGGRIVDCRLELFGVIRPCVVVDGIDRVSGSIPLRLSVSILAFRIIHIPGSGAI